MLGGVWAPLWSPVCWGTLYCAASTKQLKQFRLYSSLLLCVTLERADSGVRSFSTGCRESCRDRASQENSFNIGKVYKYSVQFV